MPVYKTSISSTNTARERSTSVQRYLNRARLDTPHTVGSERWVRCFEDLEFITSVVHGRQTRFGSVQFTVDAVRR